METSVTWATAKSASRVPVTDTSAIANGSDAATTPPNTSTSNTSVAGMARLSARARSEPNCSSMAASMASSPPTPTVMGPRAPA